MRILQINNNHYPKGGAEVVYLNTIKSLKDRGHDVIEFSQISEKEIRSDFKEYFIENTSSLFNKLYNVKAAKNIRRLINDYNPEIAHFHNIIGGLSFSILHELKKQNIPVLVTIHDYRFLCPVYTFLDGQKNICELCKGGKYYNCFLKSCSPEGRFRSFILAMESYFRDAFLPFDDMIDFYLFVSKFAKAKFKDHISNIDSRSFTTYNTKDQVKSKKKHEGYFFFFGRLSDDKGIVTLLNTFKNIPNQRLKIAGEGELKSFVQKSAGENIEYLGFKHGEELSELVENAKFVIVPSEWYENNPMTIVESFSVGTPVIGSRLGGISELIEEGKTGYLFEHTKIKSLNKAVNKASNIDDKDYIEMSKAAVEFAQRNFSSEIYLNELVMIYNNLINEKRSNA